MPIATHLRYIPDFGYWKDKVILAADDASILQNPIVGQPQSNLWFGKKEALHQFGPRMGWGGVWHSDLVTANQPSDPLLVNGYEEITLHLQNHSTQPTLVIIEADTPGGNNWKTIQKIDLKGGAYRPILINDLESEWIRLKSSNSNVLTAYAHYYTARDAEANEVSLFAGIADLSQNEQGITTGIIRPARHNRGLQWLPSNGKYLEVTLNEDQTKFDFREAMGSFARSNKTSGIGHRYNGIRQSISYC